MTTLPRPAKYFPIEKGRYEVAPGLKNLGQDLGNGHADTLAFQLDSEFPRYRENKVACRAERLSKYYQTLHYSAAVSTAVNRSIAQRLCQEHPAFFKWEASQNGGKLTCALTGEVIGLDQNYELVSQEGATGVPYISAFDALCSQVQEDVAVMQMNQDGSNALTALHLCSPSHWSAEEKIGMNFIDIHKPVPGIGKVNSASQSLVDAAIRKGPYVRFVWMLEADNRLNHNPTPPPGFDPIVWKGKAFDPAKTDSPFFLRLERQVLYGLPEVQAFVFLIRTYFIEAREIRANPKQREQLRSALFTMPAESRPYKRLKDCMDQVIAWLDV